MLIDDLDVVCKENTGHQCSAVHGNRPSIGPIPVTVTTSGTMQLMNLQVNTVVFVPCTWIPCAQ